MKSIRVGTENVTPSKIVCIGRNYLEHIQELGNQTPDAMVIFSKPNSAISETLYADLDEPLHYEGEICFLIRDSAIFAVGFGLDLTKRKLQSALKSKELPWERAKAFDGAACFSKFVPLDKIEISSLSLELEIDGAIRQQGGYDLMMHKPEGIVAQVQEFMSFDDGDILMTGTPRGVGQIVAGERFVGRIKSKQEIIVSSEWVAQ